MAQVTALDGNIIRTRIMGTIQSEEDIFLQIQEAIMGLVGNPEYPYYSNTRVINDKLTRLMKEVAELPTTIYTGLGKLLYTHWLALDTTVNVCDLLDTPYREIDDEDSISRQFLVCVMYLKLAVMRNVAEAIDTYIKLLSKDKNNRVPHTAVTFRHLITIHNEVYYLQDVTEFHDFVYKGLELFAYAYSIHNPDTMEAKQYKFYMTLISAIRDDIVPSGLAHGYDGGATSTSQMVALLIERLEESEY